MKTKINLPYEPLHWQRLVHSSQVRNKVVVAGRRSGKDRMSLFEAFDRGVKMLQEPDRMNRADLNPKVNLWYIAPTFETTKFIWDDAIAFFTPAGIVEDPNVAERRLQFFKRGLFQLKLKSADKPESLVGEGLDGAIWTEFADIDPKAYSESVLPALNSAFRGPGGRGGFTLINGTPNGRSILYELWVLGQKYIPNPIDYAYDLAWRNWEYIDYAPATDILSKYTFNTGWQPANKKDYELNPAYDPAWHSWQLPTWINPYIQDYKIDDMQKRQAPHEFAQEAGAIFLEDGTGAFLNLSAAFEDYDCPIEPLFDHRYVVGLDIGHVVDFTVITVLDVTEYPFRVVHWDSVQSKLWEVMAPNVEFAARHYNNAPIMLDSGGGGITAVELLGKIIGQGYRIKGFNTAGNTPKHELISRLQILINRKQLKISKSLETLVKEMQSYRITFTRTGKFSYSAPAGKHDDAVISLALAVCCADDPEMQDYNITCDYYN